MSLDDDLRDASQRDVERALQDYSPEAVISALQSGGRFSRRTLGKGVLAAIGAAVIGYGGEAGGQSGEWVPINENFPDLFNDGVVPRAGDGRYAFATRDPLDPPWVEATAARGETGLLSMKPDPLGSDYFYTGEFDNPGLRLSAHYDVALPLAGCYGIHLGNDSWTNWTELIITKAGGNPFFEFYDSESMYERYPANPDINPLEGASEVQLRLTRNPDTFVVIAEYITKVDGAWQQPVQLGSVSSALSQVGGGESITPINCHAGLLCLYDGVTDYNVKSLSLEKPYEQGAGVPVVGNAGLFLMALGIATKRILDYSRER